MTQRFDALAEVYAASRPTYPPGLYDLLPLAPGAVVLDVGAGTGISSRGMLERGATVYAFDVSSGMLALNPVPHAIADGHALPVRDGVADLVTYAQAFHWMRADEAAREARRVLRPGGALAVWWNNTCAQDQPWWQREQELFEHANRGYSRDYRARDVEDDLRVAFDEVTVAEAPWTWRRTIDEYLVYLSSKSYVAALGDALPAHLEEQRRSLAEAFPDGVVVEQFVTRVWVAR